MMADINLPNHSVMDNLFIPGDKVVTQDTSGGLEFGCIKKSSDGKSLKVLWESGSVLRLNNGLENVFKIGLYDRPLPIGTRVRHLGKEGRVFSSNQVITAVFANQNGPGGGIIFPNLRESLLYPVLVCTVGDTVMHNGWIGLITKGIVEVTYEFGSGVKCLVNEDLESVTGYDYPGKHFPKLPSDVLEKGKWSGGLRYYNLIKYRNKSAKLLGLEIISLSVFWIDRIKTHEKNTDQPGMEITGKQNLATVFGLQNPTKDKFQKHSVLMLRWDESLTENYQNWQEAFITKYILRVEGAEDEEPFFKRAKETFPFTNRDRLAVKVLFSQTEVDILFDDESTITMMATNITEILPPPSKKLSFPDKNYIIGDVVKDNMDFFHSNKYGFILSQNYQRRTCQVKWITTNRDKSVTLQRKEMSQYDIQHFLKYQLLKNIPQVIIANGIFEGVITGLSLLDGKVKVQCAEGPVKCFYPHELEFSTKKAFLSLVDHSFTIRSIQVQHDISPNFLYYLRNNGSAILQRNSISGQRTKIFVSPEVPLDHSFSDSIPPNSAFHPDIARTLTQDIFEVVNLPNFSIWIERFQNRPDVLTAVVIGPPQTIYKEVLFFMDILIPKNYPNSLPKVVFRLPRIYNPEWVNPFIQDDGQLRIPLEILATSGSHESSFTKTFNFILRNVLCNEPYLSSQHVFEDIFDNNKNNNNQLNNDFLRELNKSRDFNETGLVAIAEYVHAVLCQPPSTWKEFVENHFYEYLSRICWRFSQYLETPEGLLENNVNLVSINERAGNGFLIHPTSESFKLAMKSRLDNINPFLVILTNKENS